MEEDLIAGLLLEPGAPVVGSDAAFTELLQTCLEAFGERSFCIVGRWIVLDVMLSDAGVQSLAAAGLEPTILYARDVLYDSRTGGPRAGAVRSTYQRSHEGVLFESAGNIFILSGHGSRKYASVPALLALEHA
ncbi:DUF6957 family protein [Pseudomonas putida]